MNNLTINRRRFILGSLVVIGSFTFKGGLSNVYAAVSAPLKELSDYQPKYFTADEWRFFTAFCDRLIPQDSEGPGALETHVPIFIDQQMLTSYGKGEDWYMKGPFNSKAGNLFGYQMPFSLQELYRRGIAATEQYVKTKYNQSFSSLTAAQKDEVIAELEGNKIDFATLGEKDLTSGYFFTRVMDNTKEGYLSDPKYGGNKNMASWVMIGFPGARASFPEWVKIHNVKYPLGPVSLSGEQA